MRRRTEEPMEVDALTERKTMSPNHYESCMDRLDVGLAQVMNQMGNFMRHYQGDVGSMRASSEGVGKPIFS